MLHENCVVYADSVRRELQLAGIQYVYLSDDTFGNY